MLAGRSRKTSAGAGGPVAWIGSVSAAGRSATVGSGEKLLPERADAGMAEFGVTGRFPPMSGPCTSPNVLAGEAGRPCEIGELDRPVPVCSGGLELCTAMGMVSISVEDREISGFRATGVTALREASGLEAEKFAGDSDETADAAAGWKENTPGSVETGVGDPPLNAEGMLIELPAGVQEGTLSAPVELAGGPVAS